MATIPQYQGNQVRNTDVPGVRFSANATAESFGGGEAADLAALGKGMSTAGYQTGLIAQDQLKTFNTDQAREATLNARQEFNDYAANNELNKVGKDAVGAPQRLRDKALEIQQKYADKLTSSDSREMFNNVWSTYAGENVMRGQNHEAQQMEVYRDQTLQGDISLASREIGQNVGADQGSIDFVQTRLADIAANVRELNKGKPASFVDERVKLAKEGILLNAAQDTAASDPATALQFLQRNRSQIDEGKARVLIQQLEKQVKQNVLMQDNRDALNRGVTEPERRLELEKKYPGDPQAVELGMAQFKTAVIEIQQTTKLQQIKAVDDYYKTNFPNGDPPADWSHEDKKKWYDDAAHAKKGVTQAEQGAKMAEMTGMFANNPEKFKTFPLNTVAPFLDKGDVNTLFQWQNDLIKGLKTPKTEAFKEAVKQANGMMSEMEDFKVTGEKLAPEVRATNWAKRNAFMSEVEKELRKLPDEEIDSVKTEEIVNKLMVKEVKARGLFSNEWAQKNPGGWSQPISFLNDRLFPDTTGAAEYEIRSGRAKSLAEQNAAPAYQTREDVRAAVANGKISEQQGLMELKKLAAPQDVKKKYSQPVASPESDSTPEPFSMNMNSELPESLVSFVKQQEGFTPKAFGDYAQTSVGYGTRAQAKDEVLTESQADERLRQELSMHYSRIRSAAKAKGLNLSDNELAALTSFDFNTGRGVDLVNTSDSLDTIKSRMAKYVKAGGKTLPGLASRRQKEIQLFEGAA